MILSMSHDQTYGKVGQTPCIVLISGPILVLPLVEIILKSYLGIFLIRHSFEVFAAVNMCQ